MAKKWKEAMASGILPAPLFQVDFIGKSSRGYMWVSADFSYFVQQEVQRKGVLGVIYGVIN